MLPIFDSTINPSWSPLFQTFVASALDTPVSLPTPFDLVFLSRPSVLTIQLQHGEHLATFFSIIPFSETNSSY